MERYPIAPSLTLAVHRRGSTPSLVQFATINAQIKKERTSPSLEVINNADTDEDSDDLSSDQNPDRLKNMGGAKSVSQPALNILHITSIRGRGNLLSAALSPESSASLKRSTSKNVSGKPPKPSGRNKKKEKMEVDLDTDVESTSAMLKRSASHGCVLSPAPSTSADEGRPPDSSDRFSNRRNTWCHASGASAVAIDNKIEQAMDLVKSHLMFAVREEVEVLKEKIAELMERINQLEVENSILRSHATQDTLAQLVAPAPPSPPSGPVS